MQPLNLRFVITGGPGSGKTTLLQALEESGYTCAPEVSRQLIKEEVAAKSQCLPWVNLTCFAEKVLERMIFQYHESLSSKAVTFYDRGIPDIVAYLEAGNKIVPGHYYQVMQDCPYASLVFLAPPWQTIYVKDNERWQSFEEAVALYLLLKKNYLSQGYDIMELPETSVKERVAFVMKNINTFLKKQNFL